MNTIFHNARIYVDKGRFAEALLINGGIISAVGSSDEILAMSGPDDIIYE